MPTCQWCDKTYSRGKTVDGTTVCPNCGKELTPIEKPDSVLERDVYTIPPNVVLSPAEELVPLNALPLDAPERYWAKGAAWLVALTLLIPALILPTWALGVAFIIRKRVTAGLVVLVGSSFVFAPAYLFWTEVVFR